MPSTAEFTRIGHDFLVPIILAVVGSVCVRYLSPRRPALSAIQSGPLPGAAYAVHSRIYPYRP